MVSERAKIALKKMPFVVIPPELLTAEEKRDLEVIGRKNAEVLRQFTKAVRTGDASFISPLSWWKDTTFVSSSYVEYLRELCTGKFSRSWKRVFEGDERDGVDVHPVIEKHPGLGWVFHTLVVGEKVYRKKIAGRFGN